MLREAEAYNAERVLKAQGDAARFLEVYEEYQKAKRVTRDRLYLETIGRILPQSEKIVVDSGMNVTLLPLMPLASGASAADTQALDNKYVAEELQKLQSIRRGELR